MDNNTIKEIHFLQDGGCYRVGELGVTSIVNSSDYFVEGDSWFDIMAGDTLLSRCNAKYVDCLIYNKIEDIKD